MNKHLVSSHNRTICLLIMLSFFRVINDSLQITNYNSIIMDYICKNYNKKNIKRHQLFTYTKIQFTVN